MPLGGDRLCLKFSEEILPFDWNLNGTLSFDDLVWPVDRNVFTGRYEILLFIWTIY